MQDKINKKSNLTISIRKINRELDGMYTNPCDITIQSICGEKTIPKLSYILVEAKNNINTKDLLTNIYNKKGLLKKLLIPVKKMFFVGILNKSPIDEDNSDWLKKHLDNIIILYSSSLDDEITDKYFCNQLKYKKEIIDIKKELTSINNNIKEINVKIPEILRILTELQNKLVH